MLLHTFQSTTEDVLSNKYPYCNINFQSTENKYRYMFPSIIVSNFKGPVSWSIDVNWNVSPLCLITQFWQGTNLYYSNQHPQSISYLLLINGEQFLLICDATPIVKWHRDLPGMREVPRTIRVNKKYKLHYCLTIQIVLARSEVHDFPIYCMDGCSMYMYPQVNIFVAYLWEKKMRRFQLILVHMGVSIDQKTWPGRGQFALGSKEYPGVTNLKMPQQCSNA